MSENIPESIPTSSDPRSSRPTKRRALSPRSKQASHLEHLFANPDKPINLPGGPSNRTSTLPPEIVANVQGSSAGAGSGEFHVYKASRRREYERLRAMDEEKEKEDADEVFERQRKEREEADRVKTEKNRLKREKARMRKGKGKDGTQGEVKRVKLNPNVNVQKEENREEGKEGAEGGAQAAPEEVGITIVDED